MPEGHFLTDPPIPDRWIQAKADIVAQGYDLSLSRYKEVVHDEVEHRPPLEIIADIEILEDEIALGLDQLKSMLK